jgi:hypothetical protein
MLSAKKATVKVAFLFICTPKKMYMGTVTRSGKKHKG